MFNRVQLKKNAKKILKKNYWWIVLVTLILSVVAGGSGLNFGSGSGWSNSTDSSYDNIMGDKDIDDIFGDIKNGEYQYRSFGDFWRSYERKFDQIYDDIYNFFAQIPTEVWILVIALIILAILIGIALSIFVMNPLVVGCRRWFTKNRTQKPEMEEIVYIFKNGYKNTVLTMFLKNLFVFLWSLLLVIPGIVKSYEYRMIPYLLAENPHMDYKEAFQISKNLMNGNKWNAFVLDLSFIGWKILAVFTFGILNIFYVSPYIALTETELYVSLCQGSEKYDEESERL